MEGDDDDGGGPLKWKVIQRLVQFRIVRPCATSNTCPTLIPQDNPADTRTQIHPLYHHHLDTDDDNGDPGNVHDKNKLINGFPNSGWLKRPFWH